MIILITSIGSFSGKFVIENCKKNGNIIIGVDINEEKYLINSKLVDKFYKVPSVKEIISFKEKIEYIIQENSITHIIPLTDLDVDFFANNNLNNKDVKILIDNKSIVNLIRNKLQVYKFFKNSQIINCIPTFFVEDYIEKCNQYPAIAKIINGRSSEHILHIKDSNQINSLSHDYIVQPKIEGSIVTVDIINDGKQSIWIQRKEIFRTSNGAGTTVEIINNEVINQNIQNFIKTIKYKGILNIEFIVNTNKVYLMDINPRFSAGIAFSNIAGYNFVTNALNFLNNQNIETITSKRLGLIISKEYQEFIIN